MVTVFGNVKKEDFSPSKLKTFEQCPFRYKRRYIDGETGVEPDNIETHEGKAFHTIAEKYKIGANVDELIAEAFKGISYSADVYADKMKEIQKVVGNIVEFKTNILNNAKTVFEEKYLTYTLDEFSMMRGIADLIYTYDNEHYEIVDYKSAKSENDIRFKFQLQSYLLMALKSNGLFGNHSISARIFYIRNNTLSKPVVLSKKETGFFSYGVYSKIKEIREKKIFEAKPGFLCKYCEYAHNCAFCYKK
jgi:CRISPR/Cas system-associated exonuclease Cas4 (RecB family)